MRDDPNEIAAYLIRAHGSKEAALEAAVKGTASAQEAQDLYAVSVWREVKNILRRATAAVLVALSLSVSAHTQEPLSLAGIVTHISMTAQ